MYIKALGCEGVDWIHLVTDIDQLQIFENMTMKP
jgi:hypothetical protein